jgi:hypothetical protein
LKIGVGENDSARLLHSSERGGNLGIRRTGQEQRFGRKVSRGDKPGLEVFVSQKAQNVLGN